jgi:2-polyprenyl-6-methoxyphenol hydroxylase-like FAD-dependent oxidoreductase
VIAGAGPNGLLLACELALAGVRPLVLESLAEPSTWPKANGIMGQAVRLLDHRGLYEKLTGDTEQPRPMPAFIEGAGAGYDSAIGSRTWNRVSPGVDTTWMSPWCRETITR